MPRSKTHFHAMSFVLVIGLAVGCGGTSEKKFVPAVNVARTALETVLEEWKSGAAWGTVEGSSTPIECLDARWQSGKKLESYEIISEEKSEGPKIFVVKMKTTDDTEEKEVKYFVFGKDPLHVFREQEYNKATGMG